MSEFSWIALLLAAYLLGSVPFGYIVGRVRGIDVRQHGSGNIGASNVMRLFGVPAGILVLLLDALKGYMGVAMMRMAGYDTPELLLLVGLCAVAGHTWSVFLRFRGGRGVATSLGVLIALAPAVAAVAFFTWVVVLLLTRYISLSSVVAGAVLPIAMILFKQPGVYILGGFVIFMLDVYRHVPNFRRLLAGTEPKIGHRVEVTK